MKLKDFDYPLPEELIAYYPAEKRELSKMMVLYKEEKRIEHRIFKEIVNILDENYVLVLNDTKVIPARLLGKKETGAKIEVFLTKEIDEDVWECLTKPAKRLKEKSKILFPGNLQGEVIKVKKGGKRIIAFYPTGKLKEALQVIGQIPLPPYIKRPPKKIDYERYQTVFAKKEGSVAAPTAGLHFTEDILRALKDKGVIICYITLHVGPGTFKPVTVEDITKYKMEEEYFEISEETAKIINSAKIEGKKILACGTTVTRALESAATKKGTVRSLSGWTSLFIYPGYKFKIINALLTNFHLPKSTLLMLVCAFAGRDFIMRAYHEAIRKKYRFYSYGDCMLII